jgi:hypothetical protein
MAWELIDPETTADGEPPSWSLYKKIGDNQAETKLRYAGSLGEEHAADGGHSLVYPACAPGYTGTFPYSTCSSTPDFAVGGPYVSRLHPVAPTDYLAAIRSYQAFGRVASFSSGGGAVIPNTGAVMAWGIGLWSTGQWYLRYEFPNLTSLNVASFHAHEQWMGARWRLTDVAPGYDGPDTYSAIPDGDLDADSPGSWDKIPNPFRLNSFALNTLVQNRHFTFPVAPYVGYTAHRNFDLATVQIPGSCLIFGAGGWNPPGLLQVISEAALAYPAAEDYFDLWAPAVLGADEGFIAIPFLNFISATTGHGAYWDGIRATPTMLKLIIGGENTIDVDPPTGVYGMEVWKMPVLGQDTTPTVAVWPTLDESETAYRAELNDVFFGKLKNRDEYIHQQFLKEHTSDGEHAMGFSQVHALPRLARQAIVANPAGAAIQAFPLVGDFTGVSGHRFIEVFSDGAGDTGLDLRLGVEHMGSAVWRNVLIAELVAGGTVTTNYEVRVWDWDFA